MKETTSKFIVEFRHGSMVGEALTDYEPIQEVFVGSSNLSTDGTLMNVQEFQLQFLKPSVLALRIQRQLVSPELS